MSWYDHHASYEMELAVRYALKLDTRGGPGSVSNADMIDIKGGAYRAILVALAPYYRRAIETKAYEELNRMHEFEKKWHHLIDMDSKGENGEVIKEAAKELRSLLESLEQKLFGPRVIR